MNDRTATEGIVAVSRAIREALGDAKLTEVPEKMLFAVHRIVWAWNEDLVHEVRRRMVDTPGTSKVDEVLADFDSRSA